MARARCGPCPVAEACLLAALVDEEGEGYRFGVRGGLTPKERATLAARLPRGEALRALAEAEQTWVAA